MTLEDLTYSMALVSTADRRVPGRGAARQQTHTWPILGIRPHARQPQLQTRLFYFEHVGAMLVPVADMANHANACPHSISSPLVSTCGPDSQRGCVVWRAAADIPAGGEACYAYTRHMLNDRALLQVGRWAGQVWRSSACISWQGAGSHACTRADRLRRRRRSPGATAALALLHHKYGFLMVRLGVR